MAGNLFPVIIDDQKRFAENRMLDPPKRLAIFVPDMVGGGAQRVMLNLAQGIAECGYHVDLVLAQAEGAYLAQVPKSVRLVELNARHLRARRTLASLPALVRYLRRERPEAMLSGLNHANIVALWARRLAGVPMRVVLSEHSTFSVKAQHMSIWRSRQMSRLVKHFYPWADGIVAVSKGVADDLAQVVGIPRENIQVIYNPVITPELREKAQAPLDHPWFEPGEPPVVLAVGRLGEQKDFPILIRAFAQMRRARPVRLLILGEGPDRPELETLIRKLGLEQDVSLPGFVENPYAYMAHASLFVLSSSREGLPTVLIEALYCGAPLVATDCPSGPREILQDGQYGQLVPIGDMNALARAIGTTLAGKTPHPPRESWLPFDLEAVVNQYINILFGS
jgi:glycosyltransferase involved in cell wall biosynthesis